MYGQVSSEPGQQLLRLAGEFDLSNARAIVDGIAGLDGDGGMVKIDMSGVTFIDSSGLHALHRAAEATKGGAPLVLLDVPSPILRVMELLGMDRVPRFEFRSRVDD